MTPTMHKPNPPLGELHRQHEVRLTEAQIQRAVLDHWRKLGTPNTLVAAIPNMGAMGQYGLTKGLPDLLVIGPNGAAFLELKAENGRTSKHQVAFRELCAANGVPCRVTWGRDEPINVLRGWGVVK